jgi:hypothetical protein
MMKKYVFCTVLVLLVPVAASAQVFEIGAHGGYTLTGGIEFAPTIVGGNTFDEIRHVDSFSWGFTAGAKVRRGYGIGFLFDRQESRLEASGPLVEMELSDISVDNYHGVISFDYPVPHNPSSAAFLFIGFGATSFGEATFAGRSVDGPTEFSTTWGGGFKMYPNDGAIGLKLAIRWTPTYVKTDPDGYWCDPYWGCTTYGDPDYIHQVEFMGGVSYRFTTH